MMSRRSFLEAAAWLAAAGSLAGCSSDGTAGVARGSAPGTVTADTPIYDVINNPLFDGYGRLLFPTTLHPPTEDMALDDLSACLPWYSEIHTSTTVDVVSYLLSERAAERTVFYDIYTDAEKAADPSLANTGLFRFAAEGVGGASAPFAVVSAGGGFAYVAAMHDSFPHCLHLARAGINGFAVIYRPDAQLPARTWPAPSPSSSSMPTSSAWTRRAIRCGAARPVRAWRHGSAATARPPLARRQERPGPRRPSCSTPA